MARTNSTELLRGMSIPKRNPEYAAKLQEIQLANAYAEKLLKEGKLTKREYEDVVARGWEDDIEFTPDMSLEELGLKHEMAGHDGSRPDYDVKRDRDAAVKKIKAHLLDEKWLNGEIDSKTHAELHREHVGGFSEKLADKLADGDFDAVSSERFAETHDKPHDHSSDLNRWIQEKFAPVKSADKASNRHWKPGEQAKPAKREPYEEAGKHERKSEPTQRDQLSSWMEKTYGKSERGGADAAAKTAMPSDYDMEASGPPVADADGVIDWDNQPVSKEG